MADSGSPLDPRALERALDPLEGWQSADGKKISKSFRFTDFREAFGFMTRVALLAEKHGHHPDWTNSYNRVEVSLSTHDKGGVTGRDIALAEAIDGLI